MVNEVVMYQSMFLLGVLMFGFFATSFNNYSDFAETVTLDNNLERVLQEISQELLDMLDRGAELRGSNSSFEITVKLTLDSSYATQPYFIDVDTTDGNVRLVAEVQGEIIAELPLNINQGSSFENRDIDFSGRLSSSSIDTQMTYNYDVSESIIFSS